MLITNNNNNCQLLPPSWIRYTRNVACTVFIDIWTSAISFLLNMHASGRTQEETRLKKKACLNTPIIVDYSEKLRSTHQEFQLVSSLMCGVQGLPTLTENITKIAIPLILKGRIQGHIVTVFVDRESKKIEYYDPKGLTIRDRTDSELEKSIDLIIETYGSGMTLVENTTKHQYDCHNCGVYVLNYFKRRLDNETAETIFQNGRSFRQINGPIRDEIATP